MSMADDIEKNPNHLDDPPVKKSEYEQYIGDSVYLDFDGYYILIYTNNGLGRQNIIALEPQVIQSFDEYKKWLNSKLEEKKI